MEPAADGVRVAPAVVDGVVRGPPLLWLHLVRHVDDDGQVRHLALFLTIESSFAKVGLGFGVFVMFSSGLEFFPSFKRSSREHCFKPCTISTQNWHSCFLPCNCSITLHVFKSFVEHFEGLVAPEGG